MQARSVQARLFAGGPRVRWVRSRERRRCVSARADADWVVIGSVMLGCVGRNATGATFATAARCGKAGQRAETVGALVLRAAMLSAQ